MRFLSWNFLQLQIEKRSDNPKIITRNPSEISESIFVFINGVFFVEYKTLNESKETMPTTVINAKTYPKIDLKKFTEKEEDKSGIEIQADRDDIQIIKK